jgi:hypothetical protein
MRLDAQVARRRSINDRIETIFSPGEIKVRRVTGSRGRGQGQPEPEVESQIEMKSTSKK